MNSKVVVISGCSTGIGRCAAEVLHKRGYRVVATVRKSADAESLKAFGIADVLQLELASSDSVTQVAEQISELCDGRLFALFNNAAYGQPGAVEDLSRETLMRQFNVNVFGTHELTCRLLPALRASGNARIIQNSSVLGFAAMPMRGAYNASKFALEGLTDTLRMELSGSCVKVSIIQPGPILSAFRKNALLALEEEIDIAASRHAEKYSNALARLRKEGPAAPFTLPPEAVIKKLLHALESKNPKQRYKVTFPTYLMATLKLCLPGKVMDRVMLKVGK